MVRSTRSRSFIAVVSAFGAGVLPAAGVADTGGIPIDPPACISVLPTLTTSCPQPAQPQPQSQPSSVASTQSTPSSQAGPAGVSAVPSLARSLVAEGNRTRRAYGFRPLPYSAPPPTGAPQPSPALPP